MAAVQPVTTDIDLQTAAQFGEAVKRIHDEIRQVIVGQAPAGGDLCSSKVLCLPTGEENEWR